MIYIFLWIIIFIVLLYFLRMKYNNFYIIAKNTTEFYNLLKYNNDYTEQEKIAIAWIADASYYIMVWNFTPELIIEMSKEYNNLEDFLLDFCLLLISYDVTKEQMEKALSAEANIKKFKSSIKKWIKNAKLNNQNLAKRLYNAEIFYNMTKYNDIDLDMIDFVEKNRYNNF